MTTKSYGVSINFNTGEVNTQKIPTSIWQKLGFIAQHDTIVSNKDYNIVINEQVRLTRQVGNSASHFTEAWAVYQNDVKIGYVYLLKDSVLWGWKNLNSDELFSYDTRGDATDALIRYCSTPV